MIKFTHLCPCSSVDRALASGAKNDGSSPSRGIMLLKRQLISINRGDQPAVVVVIT
jgi:hypothetical protein